MKRAFVTGGSGFLGRRLVATLVDKQVPVVALARSDAAAAAVTAAGATPARGDLDDVAAMTKGMAGCDVVFHCAARAEQHGTLAEFTHANVTGTEHVLAAARAAGVARFVHVSTEAVLADGNPIVNANETAPYPAKPVGNYPITKGQAERLVIAANAEGFTTVIVRPRFIWGKGDTSVMAEMIAAVKAGKFAWIGGGHYPTSTCHVANVVEGMIRAAQRGTGGEIYFLTDGAPIEFRAFITELLATQGVDAGTKSLPRWVVKTAATLLAWMKQPPITKMALALMSHEVTVDDSKARRELGYVGSMSRAAGMEELKA